jgi:hypothetical protein
MGYVRVVTLLASLLPGCTRSPGLSRDMSIVADLYTRDTSITPLFDLSPPRPPDLLAVDFLVPPDLATIDTAVQPVDMSTPRDMSIPQDMSIPADMVQCGTAGKPCCNGTTCTGSLICMYLTDICNPRGPSVCAEPFGCGTFSQSCCDTSGGPTSVGYCPAPYRCKTGKCQFCP